MADIVLCGTGSFAARILFDLAATAPRGLSVAVVGRDAAQLAWLRTAARARADMFGTGVLVTDHACPDLSTATMAPLLAELRPRVVANTASIQGGRNMAARPDGWTRLTQQAGLGISAALQARLSLDIAAAVATAAPQAAFVNCCYPDVVNPMIAAAGLSVASGIGNVAILAHAFAGQLGPGHGRIQLLAQHAALAAFRRPADQRGGQAPLRLWLDGQEVADVFARFAAVKLTPAPALDISGASGVPLFVALALGKDWQGHVPGPNGLSGGYPVRLSNGTLRLDLPPGITEAEAIAWNTAFEAANGVVVGKDGMVRFTGRVAELLGRASPDLAAGFAMADFDAACDAFLALRTRLREQADAN